MNNSVTIETFDPSHDVYGNPTAHYIATYDGKIVAESGARREQIGYCGRINQAALYRLGKLGFNLDTNNKRFERGGGAVEYNIISIDDMKNCFYVELLLNFEGRHYLNSIENRFNIKAKTQRGVATKISKYTGLKFQKTDSIGVYKTTSKHYKLVIKPFNFEVHSHIEVIEL